MKSIVEMTAEWLLRKTFQQCHLVSVWSLNSCFRPQKGGFQACFFISLPIILYGYRGPTLTLPFLTHYTIDYGDLGVNFKIKHVSLDSIVLTFKQKTFFEGG